MLPYLSPPGGQGGGGKQPAGSLSWSANWHDTAGREECILWLLQYSCPHWSVRGLHLTVFCTTSVGTNRASETLSPSLQFFCGHLWLEKGLGISDKQPTVSNLFFFLLIKIPNGITLEDRRVRTHGISQGMWSWKEPTPLSKAYLPNMNLGMQNEDHGCALQRIHILSRLPIRLLFEDHSAWSTARAC